MGSSRPLLATWKRQTETRTHRCTCTADLTTVTRELLCVVLHRAEKRDKRDKSGEKRDKSEAIKQEAQHNQPASGLPSLESCLGSPLLYSEQGTQNTEQPRPLCKVASQTAGGRSAIRSSPAPAPSRRQGGTPILSVQVCREGPAVPVPSPLLEKNNLYLY